MKLIAVLALVLGGVLALALALAWVQMPPAVVLAAAASPTSTPSGYIVGFVYQDVSGNGVLDAGEPMIVGATVTAQQASDVRTMVTAANGWFGFYGLPNGIWTLAASCPNYRCEGGQITVADGKAYLTLAGYPELATPTPTGPPTQTPTATAVPPTHTPAPHGLTWTPLPGLCGRVCVAGLPELGCWDVCLDSSYRMTKVDG